MIHFNKFLEFIFDIRIYHMVQPSCEIYLEYQCPKKYIDSAAEYTVI